jgi:hypothetical protein
VRTFVEDHAERVTGRPVQLFDLLTVLRRCTPGMPAALLAEQGVSAGHSTELYDWLRRCDFTTLFDDNDDGWRLHDYLRENLDRLFRQARPEQYAEQHAAVERYYRARMNFDNEIDELSPHAAGSRYEDPEWQRDSQEWLHHAAHVSRREFHATKRAMIRLYLESFFWWGADARRCTAINSSPPTGRCPTTWTCGGSRCWTRCA